MIKFAIKSLTAIAATTCALLLNAQSSNAQVNMKMLSEVAKSCQRDAVSVDYYQRMGVEKDGTTDLAESITNSQTRFIEMCIFDRYHYSLVNSNYPWLESTGEMLPGYPGSVAVAALVAQYPNSGYTSLGLLDCIATQDASSKECELARIPNLFLDGYKYRENFAYPYRNKYLIYVCQSCVVAHDDILSRQKILNSFIQWFLTLDKPQRRELMSMLGDETSELGLRAYTHVEASRAVVEYQEVRQRVQKQEQEKRRQELLGK
jgi:hypothetical protein